MIKARSYKIFIFFFACLLTVNTLKAQNRETEKQWISKLFGHKTAKPIELAIRQAEGTLFYTLWEESSGKAKPGDLWTDTTYRRPFQACDSLEKKYQFIIDLEAARPYLVGERELSNYQYWLNVAHFAKMSQKLNCLENEMETYALQCRSLGNESGNQIRIASLILDLRKQAAEAWHRMLYFQNKAMRISGYSNAKEIGKQNQMIFNKLTQYDRLLEDILGKSAPELKIPVL